MVMPALLYALQATPVSDTWIHHWRSCILAAISPGIGSRRDLDIAWAIADRPKCDMLFAIRFASREPGIILISMPRICQNSKQSGMQYARVTSLMGLLHAYMLP